MYRTVFGAVAATAMSLSASTVAQAKDVVNVVCVTQEWCEGLRAPFLETTGIRMNYLNLRFG